MNKIPPELKRFAEAIISDDEFKKFVMDEVEFNAKLLKEGADHIVPRLVVFSKQNINDEWKIVPVMFTELPEDKKEELFMGLGATLHDMNLFPLVLTFVSEAWGRSLSKNELEKHLKKGKRIKNYKDKQECIIVVASTIDQRHESALLNIERDEQNKIIPGKIQFTNTGESNLLLNIFKGWYLATKHGH